MSRDLSNRLQRLESQIAPSGRPAMAFVLSGGNGLGHNEMTDTEAHEFLRSQGHESDERDTIVWLFNFGEPLHVMSAYPIEKRAA